MLTLSGVSVSYGGLHALAGVSLDVAEAEFVTIVGPNGAGKTTLLKAISGTAAVESGRIEFRGRELGGLGPSRRAALGIAHVPEGRRVFPSLTVLENLEMGSYRAIGRGFMAQPDLLLLDEPSQGLGPRIVEPARTSLTPSVDPR